MGAPAGATEDNVPVGWIELAQSDPNATVYALPEYALLLSRAFSHRVFFILVADEDNRPLAGLVLYEKNLFPWPLANLGRLHYAFAPPIFAAGTDRAIASKKLFEKINSLLSRRASVSLGVSASPIDDAKDLFDSSFAIEKQSNVVVDLMAGTETIFASFDKNVRKNIRHGAEAGLKVDEAAASDIDIYFSHYAAHHRARGLSVYPKSYFEGIYSFLAKGNGKFWIAKYKGQFAAGLAVSSFQNRLYELAIASATAFQSLAPNDALKWRAIQYGCETNCRYFDLSNIDPNAAPGSPTDGINRFKKKWGKTVEYPRYKKTTGWLSLWRHSR